jgi:hypothetical protein
MSLKFGKEILDGVNLANNSLLETQVEQVVHFVGSTTPLSLPLLDCLFMQ